MTSEKTQEPDDKPFFSVRLIWAGMVGVNFSIIGLLWSYLDYSLWRARYEPATSAGLDVEVQLPVLPRVLALLGVSLIAMTLLTICGKLLMRLWRCLIKTVRCAGRALSAKIHK